MTQMTQFHAESNLCCGIHGSFVPCYFWKTCHLIRCQEKYHYLSTVKLLQNRNLNSSLPVHSFLLNPKQFYRSYFWSLFGFFVCLGFLGGEGVLLFFCLFGLSCFLFVCFFHLLTEMHLRLFLASLDWVMKQHALAPVSLTSNLLIPGCHPCGALGYASDKSLAGLLESRVLQTMEKRGMWKSCIGIQVFQTYWFCLLKM